MILAFLLKQEVVFLEDDYWDKGRRIGNLIYDPMIREWRFWAERGDGISISSLHQIASKIDGLNKTRLT